MEKKPVPGDIYQHFKGNLYRIVTLAEHTETGEQMVVYQALYGEFQVYARPLSLFMSEVDHEKYPDARMKYRFTPVPSAGVVLAGVQQAVEVLPEEKAKMPGQKEADDPPIQDRSESVQEAGALDQTVSGQEEEFRLDPGLLAFLEADSYEKKLEVFATLAGKTNESMLNTIAASLDLELSGGSLQEQYETLKNCLLTLERYECSRLR